MFTKALSVVLLTCALFSGQLMAGHKGHEFMWVKNVDHQLRHEADSDESFVAGCGMTPYPAGNIMQI